jgi:hypothetical protein
MLTVATYQGGRVYVKGDVTIKDGLIEVPENSGSHPVIIVDSVTGEVKVVGSEELTQLEKKTL